MVKSKINPDKVIYNETKSIDDGDIGYASSVYEIELYNNDIEIVLGREKYTYSDYGIIYYTIYLLLGSSPVARIGVFEIESNKLISILDEDNDIDLSKGNILLFDNEEYIIKKINEYKESHQDLAEVDEEVEHIEKKEETEDIEQPDNQTADDDSDDDATRLKIPENKKSKENEKTKEQLKDGVFDVDGSITSPKTLSEETEEDSDKMKRDYVENSRNVWIQQFMKNEHYNILDVPGDGDCFFHTLVEAYAQIGHKTTTDKLRALLADEVTDEIYQQYRTLYMNFLGEIQAKEKEMKDTKKIITELKKRSEKTSDKEESNTLLKEAKNMVEQYNKFKIQKDDTKEMMSEFEFMEGVDSYEKFKGVIKKRDFWADTWAISTLEKKLNMKCIILSEEAYKNGDLDSVLQCGQLNDDDVTNTDNYSPEYYIIVSHQGNHYQLITYKEKRILKYPEIPYDIKSLIINKCMEKNAGPYYLIKEFRNLKTKLGLSPDEGAPVDDENEDIQMYDPETIFMFYSKSANAKVGKGSGEKINKHRLMDFNTLNKDKVCEDWRKKLDDDWISPFKIDGKRWASVEHYFLGSQYKKGYPDIYATFSLDSETDISKDVTMAKQAAKKSNKLKSKQKVPDHVKIDADFFEVGVNPRYIEERKRALVAKFSQNLDLKKILMETKNAKLMQFKRGDTPKIDDLLMKVRLAISDEERTK